MSIGIVPEPPLNVDYWASLYPVYTNYAEQYEEAMNAPRLVDRAEQFWEWKGLNRSIPFESIEPTLSQLDEATYITRDPRRAIESLSDHLIDEDVVGSDSFVTAAFLLHLMASGPDQYSVKFPIYDRRVWNAYVYLWELRGEGDRLYSQASQSSAQYAEFCRAFQGTCPDGRARAYERALFMFGGFISRIPPKDTPTPIERIDEVLEFQEQAVARMRDADGYSLVNLNAVENSIQ